MLHNSNNVSKINYNETKERSILYSLNYDEDNLANYIYIYIYIYIYFICMYKYTYIIYKYILT